MDRLSRNTVQPAPQPSTPPTAALAPRPWRVVASEGSSKPGRRNIAMPCVVPELAEMLKNDGTIAVRSNSRPAGDISSPHPLNAAVADANLARVSDTNLARIMDAWPKLPGAIRTAILAMIEATQAAEATPPGAAPAVERSSGRRRPAAGGARK